MTKFFRYQSCMSGEEEIGKRGEEKGEVDTKGENVCI